MNRRSLFALPALGLRAAAAPSRLERAARLRSDAILRLTLQPEASQAANADGSGFSKGLPHTADALPDPFAYRAYLDAIDAQTIAAFEAIPMGGAARFACPLGAHTFDYQGLDSCQFSLPPAPAISSAAHAADMAEVYWRAVTRDVPYADFDAHPLTRLAARDLAQLSGYQGPDPAIGLFRGNTAGDLIGPAISQFLWQPIPFGTTPLPQRWLAFRPGSDYLTTMDQFLAAANGSTRFAPAALLDQPRYILTPRDLASYVWKDFSYQAFLNAALILLGWGGAVTPPDNPYRSTRAQAGFVNFGGPMVLDFVARAANTALRAAWFQKWQVHRRLRPEETAARFQSGAIAVHSDLHRSAALAAVRDRFGSAILPMAYPEGCPLHPSYPAGHAAIAGACVAVLKVLFDPRAPIPAPVVPAAGGQTLTAYAGPPLTVGGELDKLASNIALGRDAAGVHYRSDGLSGIRLGEQVAAAMLADLFVLLPELDPAAAR
jgi:membrane-associated phospholipid phosphatase